MTQSEAVIVTLKKLGGIATLGQLNHEVFKVTDCLWKTKTPFASIRRIVQLNEEIYKVKPGLYALKKFKNVFESQGIVAENKDNINQHKQIDFNHSYYQGLLLQIGKMKNFTTYIPPQDKNKLFLNKHLSSFTDLSKIYDFSYPEIVSRAKTIDVIWFNERKLLSSVFEIEHSTDIQNSLLKYNDLQDFNSKFYIVGAVERKKEFEQKLKYSSFKDIRTKIDFIDYNYVSDLHTKMSEMSMINSL